MAKRIRPPKRSDVTAFMRALFLRTERELIAEINRKRGHELVDYAEAASLERVQRILQDMVDESWSYVPEMIETIFYRSDKDAAGYRNARALTATQTAVVQQLGNNLLGELTEASETAYKSVERLYTIARLEKDPLRELALKQVLAQEASGRGWRITSEQLAREMQNKGITAFVDKAGRQWSLQSYGNMAVRTTARQAQVAAILTADDYDLWQIVKIGSTCPVCAPLEGRVYSKSGTSPDYPPLSLAFGKVDPFGPEDLTNTYLNIHPNCLHALVKYTTIGKSDKQIQRDKEFSNPITNPITRDPRTKKQIEAYREKEKARQKLLRDMRQHKEYRAVLGKEIPKDFAKFQEMKYNNPEKWKERQKIYRDVNWQKKALSNRHASGTDQKVPSKGIPYSVYDKLQDGKIVQRRYYGRTGKPRLDIDFTNHGNSKKHPVVPHRHGWQETADGKIERSEIHDMPLEKGDIIANEDIIKGDEQ